MNLPNLPILEQPGRTCGPCSACCKTLPVLELEKPAAKWCAACVPGRGCAIHEDRPEICRAFACAWLKGALGLEELDRPDRTGLIVCGRESIRGREGWIVWADSSRYLTAGRKLLARLEALAWKHGRPVFVYIPHADTAGRLLTLNPDGAATLEELPAGTFSPANPNARAPRAHSEGV